MEYVTLVIFSCCIANIRGFKLISKYGGYVFEGDMIMSKEDINVAINEGDVRPKAKDQVKADTKGNGPETAKSTAKYRYRWPGGIVPYVVNSDLRCVGEGAFKKTFCFLGGASDVIDKAIKEWEQKTCIKFKPRVAERDYIEFIDDGIGKCYSNIGRAGGRQVLALGRYCRKTGIVIHEIGHALGFFHEQSRPDRDNYVTINWKNIQKGMQSNFKKYSYGDLNDQGMAYDYDSIMHYPKDAFTKWPWQQSIVPKQRGAKIGNRKHLSEGDIAEMNKYYDC